jgi:hypothetical protein
LAAGRNFSRHDDPDQRHWISIAAFDFDPPRAVGLILYRRRCQPVGEQGAKLL